MHRAESKGFRARPRSVAALVAIAIALTALSLPPAVRGSAGTLNPPHSDRGLDTDSDLRFDYLVVSVGVAVTAPGGFFVITQLYDGTGMTFIAQGQRIVDLQVGANAVDVRIAGYSIWQSGIDGPYLAQIILLNDTFAFQGFGFHSTGPYLATDFEPIPARLVPPHADAGVDADGDLRFDYLAVDASVDVAAPGLYTVNGILWDSAFTTFIAFASNSTSLAAGPATVRLRFSGEDIRVAGLNGPYGVDLSVLVTLGPQLDAGKHTTATYFLSDFDAGGASFAPPHEAFVVDLDGDGFYDNLVLNAIVAATVPGYYRVTAAIPAAGLNSAVQAYLSGGTEVVQLDFLGWDLFTAGVDGPYTVDLTLWDDANRPIDQDTHTTAAYFANDFEPSPPARWIPPYTDSGRDADGDGSYDELVVNATVDAARHGTYTWAMDLLDSAFFTYIGSAGGNIELSSGRNPVTLRFPGMLISIAGVNGPYGVNLYLYDPEGRLVDTDSFVTAPYLASAFAGVPGRLTRPYVDVGVDRDGDSRLDVIAVDVPVTVTRPGTFLLFGFLIDSGFALVAFEQALVDLRPGLSTVRLNFSAMDAFRSGDGAFYGGLQLSVSEAGSFFSIGSDQFITKNYTAGPFDHGAPVRLHGTARAAGSGAPLPGIGVLAWSQSTRLQRQVATDASGYYEVWLPPGDYYVFADGPSRNAAGVFRSVSGDTLLDFRLDPPAPNSISADVSFTDWDTAAVRGALTFGEDAAFLRFQVDAGFGNGDGTASQSELDRLIALGSTPGLALSTRDMFTVDGVAYNRVNGTETFSLFGAGPITSSTPLDGQVGGTYVTAPLAIPLSPIHDARILVEFDTVAGAQAFALAWPANFAMTSFDPVTGVSVTGVGTPVAVVDPAADPNPRDFVRETWVNLTVGTTDTTPPLVTGAALDGLPALRTRSGPVLTVTATASDVGRGDWPIGGANFTRGPGNWATSVPMAAQDGAFDSATEVVTGSLATASLVDGAYSICVYASDVVPNGDTVGSCAALEVDNTPPRTTGVRLDGQTAKTVVVGTSVSLTATVSDATTGGGAIAGANFTRGAANWASSTAMGAADGAFDAPTEAVQAAVDTTGWTAGTYDLCVYGEDDVGNDDPAAMDCARLIVIDQDITQPVVTDPRAQPNPANVSENVDLSAVVNDDIGVTAVYIQILDGSGQTVANLTAAYDAAAGRYTAGRAFTAPGTYTYRVWARDAAGNWGTASSTFTVAAPPSGGPTAGGFAWIVIAILVAAAILAFVLWARRKRQTPAGVPPPSVPPPQAPDSPPSGPPTEPAPPPPEPDEIDSPLLPPS